MLKYFLEVSEGEESTKCNSTNQEALIYVLEICNGQIVRNLYRQRRGAFGPSWKFNFKIRVVSKRLYRGINLNKH